MGRGANAPPGRTLDTSLINTHLMSSSFTCLKHNPTCTMTVNLIYIIPTTSITIVWHGQTAVLYNEHSKTSYIVQCCAGQCKVCANYNDPSINEAMCINQKHRLLIVIFMMTTLHPFMTIDLTKDDDNPRYLYRSVSLTGSKCALYFGRFSTYITLEHNPVNYKHTAL